jgi:hypothetical protein
VQVLVWVGSAVGAVTVVLTAWRVVIKPIAGAVRRVVHFLDDWFGEPARPGQEARPGIPDRIAAIEHQLRPNGGKTLRDRVDVIESAMKRIDENTRPDKEG